MYFSNPVKIPEIRGKITISRKRYVMYETGREYNAEKQYNVPRRVTIGKLTQENAKDPDFIEMYPTEWFAACFPEQAQTLQIPTRKRSDSLRVGQYLAERHILSENIEEIAEQCLGKTNTEILFDLCACMLSMNSDPVAAMTDYLFWHPAFSDLLLEQGAISIQKVFGPEWVNGCKEVLSALNRVAASENRIFFSWNRRKKYGLQNQSGFEFGCSLEDGSPFLLERRIFEKEGWFKRRADRENATDLGLWEIGFVMENSSINKAEVIGLDLAGCEFLIAGRQDQDWTDQFFRIAEKNRVSGSGNRGKINDPVTYQGKLFADDSKERYIHIFPRNMDHAGSGGADKCFPGPEVIVTSEPMTAMEAARRYQRWTDMNDLFEAGYLPEWQAASIQRSEEKDWMLGLLQMLGLLLRGRLLKSAERDKKTGNRFGTYRTVQAAIRELEKLEMSRYADGIYRLRHSLTDVQKRLFEEIGISETAILSEAEDLSSHYAALDGIKEKKDESGKKRKRTGGRKWK